jgi:ABC-type multidrug transport system fused ATPase/permease subunit
VLACLAWLIQNLESDPAQGRAGWAWGTMLVSYLGLAGLAFLAGEAVRLVSTCIVRRACARLKRELTITATTCQHRADLASLLAEPVGTRLERTLGGVEGLTRLLSVAFLDLLPATSVLVFALGYAFVMQPLIGLLLVCAAPILLYVSARRMAGQQGVRRTSHECRERVDGMLAEQFSGSEHIRAANTERQEVRRVAGVLAEWRREQLGLYLRTASYHSLTTLSGWLFQFAVIALAVALSGMGRMPVGAVAIYGNMFFSVYVPLWRIHWAAQETQDAGPRVEAFLAILGEPADRSFALSGAAAVAPGA